MDTNPKVAPVPPVAEPATATAKPDAAASASSADTTQSPNVPAYISQPEDYRLVIDKDPVSGAFIYRTVDRYTGETVLQFPNEEVVRLRDSAAYAAGTVFSGKV